MHHAIQVLPAGHVLLLLLFRLLTPVSSCPPPPLPLSTFAEIHPTPAVSGDFRIDPDAHASDLIAGTSDAEDLLNLVTYYTGDCSTENFAVDAITLAQQVAMPSIQVLLPVLYGVSGGSVFVEGMRGRGLLAVEAHTVRNLASLLFVERAPQVIGSSFASCAASRASPTYVGGHLLPTPLGCLMTPYPIDLVLRRRGGYADTGCFGTHCTCVRGIRDDVLIGGGGSGGRGVLDLHVQD